MNYQVWLLLLSLLTGFIVAGSARLGPRSRTKERIASAVLIAATVTALGASAFAWDSGLLLPSAWFGCATFVLLGISLCGYIYAIHRFRFALTAGAGLAITLVSLHVFALPVTRACQWACAGVRTDMKPDEVKAAVLRRLPEQEQYRAILSFDSAVSSRIGCLLFELHPKYSSFEAQTIMVFFDNGRATNVSTSAVRWPPVLFPPTVGATLLLCVVCVLRLRPRVAEERVHNDARITALSDRLHRLRAQGYLESRWHGWSAFFRRGLVSSARRRIRHVRYFGERQAEADDKPSISPRCD
jgi:hypothetical protein